MNDDMISVLTDMQKCLDEMLKVLQNPPAREVTIGELKRDESGQIVGANIGKKLQ